MDNEMKKRVMSRRQSVLVCIILIWSVITLWIFFRQSNNRQTKERIIVSSSHHYNQWPPFGNTLLLEDCFEKSLNKSLSALEYNLKLWQKSETSSCNKWYNKFNDIYTISFRAGSIKIPRRFLSKVTKWLNNNQNLLKELLNQHVIHILNKPTKEYSAFSPLRSKRPQTTSNNSLEYVEKLIDETSQNCDFCNYQTMTSEDTFGRIKTNYCISAANTFKVDRWHSLIIPFKHNPMKLTEEETVDIFQAAVLWFNKVHSLEPIFKYPWMLWDNMPHAGASQVHPHIHVGLGPDNYVGMYENARFSAQKYFEQFGSNYFTDLVQVHQALGLAVVLGKAAAITQLTSKKDTEITVISAEPDTDFFRLIYHVTQTFYAMELYGFSSMTVFPILGPNTTGSLPAIIRIASRGDVSTVKSEISSFELFDFSNINVDPYEVIEKLRQSVSGKL